MVKLLTSRNNSCFYGRRGETIYFSLATGVLMSLYQCDPASIHDGLIIIDGLDIGS
jgi:hypothetical protein